MAFDVLDEVIDIVGMAPVGEIRLVPDPIPIGVAPWLPPTATVSCNRVGHDRQH